MNTILCLDLGTTTGYAFMRAGEIKGGSQSLDGSRGEGEGYRYAMFESWLSRLCHELAPEAIYVEDVRRHNGTSAAHVYGGLRAVAAAVAWRRRIPLIAAGVGQIKKHATGNGNAKKDQMIAAQQAKGRVVVDDNHADALALLDYARSNPCPPKSKKSPSSRRAA